MAKIKLAQAWIDRVVSDSVDDVMVIGQDRAPMPSQSELSRSLVQATGAIAFREMTRRKWFAAPIRGTSETERAKQLEGFLFASRPTHHAIAGAAMFRRQARQRD